MTRVLVPSLLHEDAAIRTAAASLAFNAATHLQKARVEAVRTGRRWDSQSEGEDIGDWQVEMASAVVEALDREKESEEVGQLLYLILNHYLNADAWSLVVHRLVACLAYLLRLSPVHDTQLNPLLEVLQVKQILKGKLTRGDGWKAEGGISKKDIRRLVEEVANKLCP